MFNIPNLRYCSLFCHTILCVRMVLGRVKTSYPRFLRIPRKNFGPNYCLGSDFFLQNSVFFMRERPMFYILQYP